MTGPHRQGTPTSVYARIAPSATTNSLGRRRPRAISSRAAPSRSRVHPRPKINEVIIRQLGPTAHKGSAPAFGRGVFVYATLRRYDASTNQRKGRIAWSTRFLPQLLSLPAGDLHSIRSASRGVLCKPF